MCIRDRSDITRYVQATDTAFYLPNDVLFKVDTATMASSLEARVPLLDHRLLEMAQKIPIEQHFEKGKGKAYLRKILALYLPEKLWNRPKKGFTPPLGAWLRGPLKTWANDAISSQTTLLSSEEHETLRNTFHAHQQGNAHEQYLWRMLKLLSFENKTI